MRKLKYVQLFENFESLKMNSDGSLEGINMRPQEWGKFKRYVFSKRDEQSFNEFCELASIDGLNLSDYLMLNFIFLPEETAYEGLPYLTFYTGKSTEGEYIEWTVGTDGTWRDPKPLVQFIGRMNVKNKNLQRMENIILQECPIMKAEDCQNEQEFQEWLSKYQRKN